MFKVNNKNPRTRCKICSKLIIKTPERCHWHRSGVVIVIFEPISPCSNVSIVNFEQVNTGWDRPEFGRAEGPIKNLIRNFIDISLNKVLRNIKYAIVPEIPLNVAPYSIKSCARNCNIIKHKTDDQGFRKDIKTTRKRNLPQEDLPTFQCDLLCLVTF